MKGGKGFSKALQSEEDREHFEELMDMCRSNAMANGAACSPIIFEPMVVSILLAQQKKLRELEYQFNEVLWRKICMQDDNSTARDSPAEAQPDMKNKIVSQPHNCK